MAARSLASVACLIRVALYQAVAVAHADAVHEPFKTADGEWLVTASPTPLRPGLPFLVSGLPAQNARCFPLDLAAAAESEGGDAGKADGKRVHVLASVVGLAGLPELRGGWSPAEAMQEVVVNSTAAEDDGKGKGASVDAAGGEGAGYQALALELDRMQLQYTLCVTTVSAQGCDAMLTAIVWLEAPSAAPPPVWLRPNYPSVWPLGGGSRRPRSLRFLTEADFLEDVRVTVVPVSGSAEAALHAGGLDPASDGCQGEVLASSDPALGAGGPAIFDSPRAKKRGGGFGAATRPMCLVVHADGEGTVAVTAGPRLPGPFLAPGVPLAGKLPAARVQQGSPAPGAPAPAHGRRLCEAARLLALTDDGADLTVTATAEDGSELALEAFLASELLREPIAKSRAITSAGTGAALVVKGTEIADAAQLAGEQGQVSLSIMVCRPTLHAPPKGKSLGIDSGGANAPGGATRFWITAMSEKEVVTLEDGLPFFISVPVAEPGEPRPWRDFRFLVPGGESRPKEVTFSASSSGKVLLTADTLRPPRGRRRRRPGAGARWEAATGQNSSRPTLRLTTEEKLAGNEVGLIDCRLPCFVYASALAQGPGASLGKDAIVDLEITAVSDSNPVVPLVEAQEITVTLAAGETKIFRYAIAFTDTAALFSVSASTGTVNFEISASSEFPEDKRLTTIDCRSVALLPPSSGPFQAAMAAAKDRGPAARPILFVRVRANTDQLASTFAVVARAEGDAKVMRNGDETNGAVKGRAFDRYRFFVSEAEARRPVQVTLEVTPLDAGKTEIWVSCEPNKYPREEEHDWGRKLQSQDRITFTTSSASFRPGWVYVAITGPEEAAYTLRAEWGNITLQLEDGREELGRVMQGDARPFELAVLDRLHTQPVAVRLEALAGKVGLCIVRASGNQVDDSSDDASDADDACVHYAEADAAAHPATRALAALDLPPTEVSRGARFRLLVRGIRAANDFVLRAMVAAPAQLAEDRSNLMDVLGPPCCVKGPPDLQLLYRPYVYFAPPALLKPAAEDEVGALLVELRCLDFLGDLAGARLTARRFPTGSERLSRLGDAGAPVVERRAAPLSNDRVPPGSLRLAVDLLHLAKSQPGFSASRGEGLWIEIGVEVMSPVNFTLRLAPTTLPSTVPKAASDNRAAAGESTPKRESRGEAQRRTESPTHSSSSGLSSRRRASGRRRGSRTLLTPLLPNVPVRGNLSHQLSVAKFQFQVDGGSRARAAGTAWRLRVRQCYGKLLLKMVYPVGTDERSMAENAEDFEGMDLDIPLVMPSGNMPAQGLALLASGKDGPPVAYELELVPPGVGSGPIVLPDPPVLRAKPTHHALVYSFSAAEPPAEGVLTYTLVAVPAKDSRVNVNTSCGLLNALERGEAAKGVPVAATSKDQSGRPVEASLALGHVAGEESNGFVPSNQSLQVNVLAELLAAPGGRRLAARSYDAVYLDAAAVRWAEEDSVSQAVHSPVAFLVAVVASLTGVYTLWSLAQRMFARCGPVKDTEEARELRPKESVELEVQYSRADDRDRDRSSAPLTKCGSYVPPTV